MFRIPSYPSLINENKTWGWGGRRRGGGVKRKCPWDFFKVNQAEELAWQNMADRLKCTTDARVKIVTHVHVSYVNEWMETGSTVNTWKQEPRGQTASDNRLLLTLQTDDDTFHPSIAARKRKRNKPTHFSTNSSLQTTTNNTSCQDCSTIVVTLDLLFLCVFFFFRNHYLLSIVHVKQATNKSGKTQSEDFGGNFGWRKKEKRQMNITKLQPGNNPIHSIIPERIFFIHGVW